MDILDDRGRTIIKKKFKKVMVNNSTNTNKTNHLKSLNIKKNTTYDVRNPDLGFWKGREIWRI
jgi:hypothetical protein